MGQIITFYSYKGGTGRTMALANIAWLLASNGNRVLAIDWDLEAPGLHRYLAPFLTDPALANSPGVIDVMMDFAKQAVTPGERSDKWYLKLANLTRYAVAINWSFPAVLDSQGRESRGYLEFIPAGQQTSTYATRVNSFNWDNFYERLGGGSFIGEIRARLCEQYDYVLVDSRTGVSDTSGICTVQLPHKVVVCFTLNNQSIEGASLAAAAVREQHGLEAARFPIFPIPTRVDYSEDDRLNLRRQYSRQRFRDFLKFLPAHVTDEQYWNEVEVPYRALYAYEELLTPFGDKIGDPKSMLASFERAAFYVTGTTQVLREMDAREQERIRREFAVVPTPLSKMEGLGSTTQILPAVTPADWPETTFTEWGKASPSLPITPPAPSPLTAAYFSFNPFDSAHVIPLRDRLRSSGLDGMPGPAVESAVHWDQALVSAMALVRRFVYFIGAHGLSSWQHRELAFALEALKNAQREERTFEIIPVLLPQAAPASMPPDFLLARAVDFRTGLESRSAWDMLVRRLGAGHHEPGADAIPFKGEAPYREEDACLFFGREEEARMLAAELSSSRITWLRGDSGAGKTSLVNAGVIPLLRRSIAPRWEILSFRPGANPFLAFADALQPLLQQQGTVTTDRVSQTLHLGTSLATGGLSVASVLQLAMRAATKVDRLLVFIDQAEELFTETPEEHRKRFAAAFQHLPPDLLVSLLVSVRPDWEVQTADLMAFRGEIPAVRVAPLSNEVFERAIHAVAQVASKPLHLPAKVRHSRLHCGWIRRICAEGEGLTWQAHVDQVLERTVGPEPVRRSTLAVLSRLSGGELRVSELPTDVLLLLDPCIRAGLVKASSIPGYDNAVSFEETGSAIEQFQRENAAGLAWRDEVGKAIAHGAPSPPAPYEEWESLLVPAERHQPNLSAPAPRSAPKRRYPLWVFAVPAAFLLVLAATIFSSRNTTSGPPPISESEDAVAQAEQALAEKRYGAAIAIYTRILDKSPDAGVYRRRAEVYREQNQFEAAERDYTNALGLDPTNSDLFTARGIVRADADKLALAAADLQKALQLYPDSKAAKSALNRRDLLRFLQTQVAPSMPPEARRSVVAQVAFEAQKRDLTPILRELKTRGYNPSPGIEVVGERAPRSSQIRYFEEEMADEATKLAYLLADLGLRAVPTFVNRRSSGDLHHFEIWVAAKAYESTSGPFRRK